MCSTRLTLRFSPNLFIRCVLRGWRLRPPLPSGCDRWV